MNPPNDPNNPAPPPQAYPPPGAYPQQPSGYPPPGYPQSQPGAWPPPPGGQYDPNVGMGENTSGMKGPVPPEIANLKWNWGAFLLHWIWCFAHSLPVYGAVILVVAVFGRMIPHASPLISIVLLAGYIYLGLNGHKLAWQNRRFDGGLPQYFAVQDAWMKWGIGLAIAGIILGIIFAVLFAAVFATMFHFGGTTVTH